MNKEQQLTRDIALIDDLRSGSSENSVVEFKHNNEDPEMIGRLCSALSNAARIAQQEVAYVLWGIDDNSHAVVGTAFDPDAKKKGNQVFTYWLNGMLKPGLAFRFRKVAHPDGMVVILEIPAATSMPAAFSNTAYVRIGSATPPLMENPHLYATLIENMRPYAWESGLAKPFLAAADVLTLLDYPHYFKMIGHRLPDNKDGILERLEADKLIIRDVGGRWNVTNLGALLFANDLSKFDSSLARKGIRFIAYDGTNKAAPVKHRIDGQHGYAYALTGVLDYIKNILPVNEHIGTALREPKPLFPEIAIRELIANALIHQDLTITGTGPQIELFIDRLEITNPGGSLVKPERMIDLPPRSRNEALASLMRRMRLCEEQGSGLDKVIDAVELFQLPPPKFTEGERSFQAVLYGPRTFAQMSVDERTRACYQHAVIRYLSDEKIKNSTLCGRFGIEKKNAAQVTKVINSALDAQLIKVADPEHPRAGYVPIWA